MRQRQKRKRSSANLDPSPEYLQVEDFGEKGRGIVATEYIYKGSFVLSYIGKRQLTEPVGNDTYVYEIIHSKKRRVWIDATEDDGSYGRLVNDNHVCPNLAVKLISVDGSEFPVPAFFALRDINPGDEITYDYGGGDYPWRNGNKELGSGVKLKGHDDEGKENMLETFTEKGYTDDSIVIDNLELEKPSEDNNTEIDIKGIRTSEADDMPKESKEDVVMKVPNITLLAKNESIEQSPTQNVSSMIDKNLKDIERDAVNEDPVAFVKERDAVNEDPVAFVKERDAVNEDPDAFVKERDAVNEDPVAFVKERDAVNEDPVAFVKERDAVNEDPVAFVKERDAEKEDTVSVVKDIVANKDEGTDDKVESDAEQCDIEHSGETDIWIEEASSEVTLKNETKKMEQIDTSIRKKLDVSAESQDEDKGAKGFAKLQAKKEKQKKDVDATIHDEMILDDAFADDEHSKTITNTSDLLVQKNIEKTVYKEPGEETGPKFQFVCSGNNRIKKQLVQLTEKCGGCFSRVFDSQTTHVIMETEESSSRICQRTIKYFMGIAHHCWVLAHEYIEKSMEAGYYLPEEEYEIQGDTVFPTGSGPKRSRISRDNILQDLDVKLSFTEGNGQVKKEEAEEMIMYLGGQLGEVDTLTVSLDEEGEDNTLDRHWLFDSLSLFQRQDIDDYMIGNTSNDDQEDRTSTVDDMTDDNYQDSDFIPESPDSMSEDEDIENFGDSDMSDTVEKQESDVSSSTIIQYQGNCDNNASEKDLVVNQTDTVNKSNKGVFVSVSEKYDDGSRKWDKRHECVYCGQDYPGKLPRHLEAMHKTELAVQRALAYEKGSKERKRAWREITNEGDFAHNIRVYEKGEGVIIPCKRPRIATKGTEYVQCKECKGTYLRSSLWRHVKTAHPKNKGHTQGKMSHQVDSASLLPVSVEANHEFREKILDKMANDEISIIVRTDSDIITFGQRQFIKHARYPHQFNYVRQKMRELARFLLEARIADISIQKLRDCIDPLKFSVCVAAVKSLCGYDESSMLFEIPSLANKIGHSLHKVARRVRLRAMGSGEKDLEAKADSFIEMYKEDWKIDVGHAALETIEIKKYNKPSQIPLAEDLKALSVYLKGEANNIMGMSEITQVEWRNLCEITLAQTVLFNKRRAGEAERLEVQQYLEGLQHGKTMHQEVLESLSPVERKLAEVINRVELRGKRGKRVAILLQENIVNQFDVLLKHRSCGNIDTENMYMFARPGDSETPVRATDVLRKFAAICGAKQPETLTSTGFRKHVATISQMLNLKDNELDVIASFLGHDIKVHREFYRLPNDTIQVAKVSKLLLELEKGNISKYKGKSLDEIQFDMDEPLEEENDDVPNGNADGAPDMMENQSSSKAGSEMKQYLVKPIRKNKNSTRKPWSEEECAAVKRQLGTFFHLNKLPGKHEIVEAQKKEPVLMGRPWSQVKFYIKNKKVSRK